MEWNLKQIWKVSSNWASPTYVNESVLLQWYVCMYYYYYYGILVSVNKRVLLIADCWAIS